MEMNGNLQSPHKDERNESRLIITELIRDRPAYRRCAKPDSVVSCIRCIG